MLKVDTMVPSISFEALARHRNRQLRPREPVCLVHLSPTTAASLAWPQLPRVAWWSSRCSRNVARAPGVDSLDETNFSERPDRCPAEAKTQPVQTWSIARPEPSQGQEALASLRSEQRSERPGNLTRLLLADIGLEARRVD